MTKRILSILLCLCTLLLCVACAAQTEQGNEAAITTGGLPSESGTIATTTPGASGSGTTAPSNQQTTLNQQTTPNQPTTPSQPSEPLPPSPPSSVETVKISDRVVYLFEGESRDLTYTSEPAGKKASEITWTASTDCVEVKDGKVTAKKEGYAIVSAGGDSACRVRVLARQMPTISIETTDGASIKSKDVYTDCTATVSSTNEALCFLARDAGIRLRGNSTAGFPKKSYRLKFDSKTNLLGMNEGAECKSWVLLAEYYDPSLARTSTGLTMAASLYREYTSDFRYVKLEVNGKDQGVYVLAEQTQINDNRIAIEEAGEDSSALRSGYLMELEGSSQNLDSPEKFFISYEGWKIKTFEGKDYKIRSTDSSGFPNGRQPGIYIELKNNGLSSAQIAFIKKYMTNLLELIYKTTYGPVPMGFDENMNLIERPDLTAEQALSQVIDIDAIARAYLFNEVVCNADEYKKSTYFYVDFSEGGTGKFTYACPWDLDRICIKFDGYNYSFEKNEEYVAAVRNVFYTMMMCHEWFREEVYTIWVENWEITNGFENALQNMGKISEIYAKELEENHTQWNRQDTNAEWNEKIHTWLSDRIAWVNTQILAMKPKSGE